MRDFKVIYTNDIRLSLSDEEILNAGLDPKTATWKELKKLVQRKLDSLGDYGAIVRVEEIF